MRRTDVAIDGQHGMAAIELALFTSLILMPVLILVASLPTWWERQSLATLAAQEAARTAALSSSWNDGVERADALAAQLAANHGVDPADLSVALTGTLDPDAEITAISTVRVPTTIVPLIVEVPSFTLSARHTELVDPFRSLPAP